MRHRHFILILLLLPCVAFGALKVDVRLEGVEGALRDNIVQELSLIREQGHPLLDVYRLRRLFQRGEGEIREALRPFGYYRTQVTSTLEQQKDTWVARYVITPGEPVHVTELEVAVRGAAADDPAFVSWRDNFPLHVGSVLDHASYEKAKRDLMQLAHDRGYLQAKLTRHELEVSVVNNSARLALALDSGPRYSFGPVHFSAVALDEELLQRYMTFAPGDPYDVEKVFDMQRQLADSDYFESVDVVAEPEQATDGTIPVNVSMSLRPRNRYTYGIGYGTDTGPRLTAGMERRRVNRHGHRFNIDATLSPVISNLKATYRIPLAHPTTDFLAFTAGWERELLDTTTHDTLIVGGGVTQQMGDWQRTLALTVQNERYTVGTTSDVTTLVLPSAGWLRVEADDRLFPTHGWRLSAEVRGASETLGSDASLLQGVLRVKAIEPLLGGRFITRADVGASSTPDFSRIPASLRFFAGGDNSIRGYAYKSLGPTDALGEVVGGRNLLVGSVEYDRYFSEHTGAAIFFDAGNAFNFDGFIPYKGAGLGLRWRLPFGTIRVDLATPVRDAKPDWRLHLGVGPDL